MSGHLCCCSGEGRAQRRRLESSVPWCPSPVVVSDVYNPSWRWPTFQRQLAAPDLVPFTSREPLRAIQTTPRKASICLSLKGNRNIKYFPVDLHEWGWHWGLCSWCEITFQGQNKTTYLCTWPWLCSWAYILIYLEPASLWRVMFSDLCCHSWLVVE